MSKTSNQDDTAPVVTSLIGPRESGFGPAFTAVATAVGVGVNEMLSSGFTTGNAIGTAAGALGAYAVTKATDASVGQAFAIGGLAGNIGVAAGRKLDAEYFAEITELSPGMPAIDGNKMIADLFD